MESLSTTDVRSPAMRAVAATVTRLPSAVAMVDEHLALVAWSAPWAALFGAEACAAGRSIDALVPLGEARWNEAREGAFAGPSVRVMARGAAARAGASPEPSAWLVTAWESNPGAPAGLLVHADAHLDREAVRQQLAEREQFIRAFFERSPIGLNLCRMDGLWIESNQAFLDIIGYTHEEADGGLTYWQLTPRRYDADEAVQLASLERTGRYGPYEKEFIRKDGTLVPVRLNGFTIERNGERYIWSIIEDIRERRRLEHALEHERLRAIHSAKLATLGQMAAGIAHEINNPLAVIDACAYALAALAAPGGGVAFDEALADIRAAVRRASVIVRGLRKFARIDEDAPHEVVPVRSLVEDAVSLCQPRMVTHGVALSLRLESDARVECSPIEIEQVLVNLLNNAFDAAKDGAERRVSLHVVDAGPSVELRVHDSGRGVPSELAEKIFEPFFTTKRAGEGTGLGLSISREIAARSGGALELEPGPPGATFVLRLPRKEAP
jgi:PAS domain S-box-containing protein